MGCYFYANTFQNISAPAMMESNYVKGNSVFVKRIRNSIGMAVVAAMVLAVLVSSQSFAQSATNSTNVLKVSPVRSDIQVKPGESKTVQVNVTNMTNVPITVSPIQNDFISADESGSPALILDANTFAPTHSLKRFLTTISNVTIPANETKTIDVVIKVPAGTQAGGYFGAIRFTPADPADGGQVSLSPNVASLILLTVPGPTTEKLDLTHFDIQQNGETNSTFRTGTAIGAYIRFENKGNIQEGPFGKITVKSGSKVVYETDFNVTEPRDQILPDGARRWTVPLLNIGDFGHFTVTATLAYGQTNETIEMSKSFWVIPQWAIIVAIALIVIIIGLIVLTIFMIRRRIRNRLRRKTHGISRYRR